MEGPTEINNVLIVILVFIGVLSEMVYIRKHPKTIQARLKMAAVAALLIEGVLQLFHFIGLVPPENP